MNPSTVSAAAGGLLSGTLIEVRGIAPGVAISLSDGLSGRSVSSAERRQRLDSAPDCVSTDTMVAARDSGSPPAVLKSSPSSAGNARRADLQTRGRSTSTIKTGDGSSAIRAIRSSVGCGIGRRISDGSACFALTAIESSPTKRCGQSSESRNEIVVKRLRQEVLW